MDGILDNNDYVKFIDLRFVHHPVADLGFAGSEHLSDGIYDSNDNVCFIDDLFLEGANTGKGRLSFAGFASGGNRRGFAGYKYDPITGPATDKLAKYHVRHRVLDYVSGKFMQMEPAGYVDGMSLYQHCRNDPQDTRDANGLGCRPCQAGGLAYDPNGPVPLPSRPFGPFSLEACPERICYDTPCAGAGSRSNDADDGTKKVIFPTSLNACGFMYFFGDMYPSNAFGICMSKFGCRRAKNRYVAV